MNKSLRPCLQPGCINLVNSGYCTEHTQFVKEEAKKKAIKSLRKLDEKKTDRERKFYSSWAWIRTSKFYRKKHPLCERCDEKGLIVKSELVHHKKELRDIWEDRGNPLKWRYLQALCRNCHMDDLRAKRKSNNNNNNQYKY